MVTRRHYSAEFKCRYRTRAEARQDLFLITSGGSTIGSARLRQPEE